MKRLALLVMLAGPACTGAANDLRDTRETPMTNSPPVSPSAFLGLRTGRYSARDLAAAKAWYADVLGFPPYFDEPFYVGFNVGGYELGIVPDSTAAAERPASGYAYWGVGDADSAFDRLIELGAAPVEPVEDVGEGIRVGTVRDPFGNLLGVIENPGFRAEQP